MIGALGALYIITDLLFEFAIEVVENGVKKLLEKFSRMDIRKCRVSKSGLEHVKKLNRKMEVEMSTEKIEGDVEIFEEMGKRDPRELYKDDLTYEGPICPSCETPTQIHNGVEECPVCGYKSAN